MAAIPIFHPLSSASFFGKSQLHLPLNRRFEKCALSSFCCRATSTIAVDVSKIVRKLRKQGIDPTPKILHHLRKKEIQKAKRKEKKQREKEDRAGTALPLEYNWSEAHSLGETLRLKDKEAFEERADNFLCFIHDEQPEGRLKLAEIPQLNTETLNSKIKGRRGEHEVGSRKDRGRFCGQKVSRRKKPITFKSDSIKIRLAVNSSQQAAESREPSWERGWEVAYRNSVKEILQNSEVCRQGEFGNMNDEFTSRLREANGGSFYRGKVDTRASQMTKVHEGGPYDKGKVSLFEEAVGFGGDILSGGEEGKDVEMEAEEKWEREETLQDIRRVLLSVRKGDLEQLLCNDHDRQDLNVKVDGEEAIYFDGLAVVREDKKIQSLAQRLDQADYWISKEQFSNLMHNGRLKFTEDRVLRLVQLLGEMGNWRRALEVVEWVNSRQRYRHCKSRYVHTTLLAVLGNAHRPIEALNVFNRMLESFATYPDMASYHSVAVTLGQAGFLKELLELIKVLRAGPSKENMKYVPVLNWDVRLSPDIIVYNAVINACVPNKEWRGALWAWKEIEYAGISPNSATYGLMIEVMVKSMKFEHAYQYYRWMQKAGFPPNALTLKSLLEAFGRAGQVDNAVKLVEQMECSGIVGSASVYYSLACALCMSGRWQDALPQVRKMQDFPGKKSDVITYTGLIRACQKAGYVRDAISLFEHMLQECAPNVETCNVMIKLYGQNGMFREAKSLFEDMKKGWLGEHRTFKSEDRLARDLFTYEEMLRSCAASEEWDYFEVVFQEMVIHGHHLRGEKNSWVLAKVAKAGKRNLVDQICHQLKEAGEVPNPILYKNQIVSYLRQKQYKMAINYFREMISLKCDFHEQDWHYLFEMTHRFLPANDWECFACEVMNLEGLHSHILRHTIGSLGR